MSKDSDSNDNANISDNNKKKRFNWKISLAGVAIFFSIVGPGIITSAVDNDAGGIATYSITGAHFGYSMLWLLVPTILLLIIIQEMSTRMGVVTGKGFSDLIRKHFGVRITFFLMLALLAANFGTTLAEFSGIAASSEIFGVSKFIAVPLVAFAVWFIITKYNYKSVEKIFLVGILFYAAYIVSGIMSNPNWTEIGRQMVIPSFTFNMSYLLMAIAFIGTTIAPWQQFYIQASVVEKKITMKDYKYTRWDVVFGGIIVGVIAFFIIIATAATIYPTGNRINDAADAALALKPLAGDFAGYVFAFGLFISSFFAAAILPLSTAFYVSEGFGWERGVDKKFNEAPKFYWMYSLLIIISASIILIPGIPYIPIMIISQVICGILLPFVLIFMLKIINNKDVMGEHTNGRIFNIVAWISCIIMITLSTLLVVSAVFPEAITILVPA